MDIPFIDRLYFIIIIIINRQSDLAAVLPPLPVSDVTRVAGCGGWIVGVLGVVGVAGQRMKRSGYLGSALGRMVIHPSSHNSSRLGSWITGGS